MAQIPAAQQAAVIAMRREVGALREDLHHHLLFLAHIQHSARANFMDAPIGFPARRVTNDASYADPTGPVRDEVAVRLEGQVDCVRHQLQLPDEEYGAMEADAYQQAAHERENW